jgi:hypothetical protein
MSLAARLVADAALDGVEVDLALEDRADQREYDGAEEAQNGVAEVEGNPSGYEQEAEQAEVLLEAHH